MRTDAPAYNMEDKHSVTMHQQKEIQIRPFLLLMVVIVVTSFLILYATNKGASQRPHLLQLMSNSNRNRERMASLQCEVTKPVRCQQCRNESIYLTSNHSVKEEDQSFSSYDYTNYTHFKQLIQSRIQANLLRRIVKPSVVLFADPPFVDMPRLFCDGLWLEFGVYTGYSITMTARWKSKYCVDTNETVFGFDSFEGLPNDWRPQFRRGAFDLGKNFTLNVPSNVNLVRGLFIDTLPQFLHTFDRNLQCSVSVTYLHVDCDIYESTRDVFYLLGPRLVRGAIIIFDELINYSGYEKHELKVLFEYMSTHADFRLRVIGAASPMNMNPTKDEPHQSVAFVVV